MLIDYGKIPPPPSPSPKRPRWGITRVPLPLFPILPVACKMAHSPLRIIGLEGLRKHRGGSINMDDVRYIFRYSPKGGGGGFYLA